VSVLELNIVDGLSVFAALVITLVVGEGVCKIEVLMVGEGVVKLAVVAWCIATPFNT